MPPVRCTEVFVSAPVWSSHYVTVRLLYVSTPPVFSYFSDMYMNCQDSKERVEMITWTGHALMSMACFFAAWHNGCSSHLLRYFPLNHHRGGFLVLLQIGILEDVEISGQYFIILLDGYDPVLFPLELWRSENVDWSRYSGTDSALLGFYFKTGHVFRVRQQPASKSSKTVSATVVSVQGHDTRCFRRIQLAIINSYEGE